MDCADQFLWFEEFRVRMVVFEHVLLVIVFEVFDFEVSRFCFFGENLCQKLYGQLGMCMTGISSTVWIYPSSLLRGISMNPVSLAIFGFPSIPLIVAVVGFYVEKLIF